MMQLNWTHIRGRLQEALLALPHFFKNPVQGMRNLPNWDWPEILILQGAFAAICAILTSAIGHNYLGIVVGIVIGPLTLFLLSSISSGFFYYVFLFYFKKEIPYRQIYINVMFAAVPALILNIISPLLPPALLLGIATSLLLFYVGCIDNFALEPVKIRKLLAIIMVTYAVLWVAQMIGKSTRHERLREKATPESLDILEKELNLGN